MTTLDSLNQYLDTCVWDQIRIIADCLEDEGKGDLALAYRLLATGQCLPRSTRHYGSQRWTWEVSSDEGVFPVIMGSYMPSQVENIMGHRLAAFSQPAEFCGDIRYNLSFSAAFLTAAEALLLAAGIGLGPLAGKVLVG